LFIKVLQNKTGVLFTVAPFVLRLKKGVINVFKVLQNESGVVSAVNFVVFTGFTLEKRATQCFIVFCKMIQAYFSPSFPVIIPVLASEKEKIIDYSRFAERFTLIFFFFTQQFCRIYARKSRISLLFRGFAK
jgi:hypothetical protein